MFHYEAPIKLKVVLSWPLWRLYAHGRTWEVHDLTREGAVAKFHGMLGTCFPPNAEVEEVAK